MFLGLLRYLYATRDNCVGISFGNICRLFWVFLLFFCGGTYRRKTKGGRDQLGQEGDHGVEMWDKHFTNLRSHSRFYQFCKVDMVISEFHKIVIYMQTF